MFTLSNQYWENTKPHFDKAYENLLIVRPSVDIPGTIMNTQELIDDEDNTIAIITKVMNTLQMVSNANI